MNLPSVLRTTHLAIIDDALAGGKLGRSQDLEVLFRRFSEIVTVTPRSITLKPTPFVDDHRRDGPSSIPGHYSDSSNC